MALAYGLVLVSFFWNFLGQFWAPARDLALLSLLHYHRPVAVLQAGAWPTTDLLILTAIAVTTWLAGGFVFARRDVCTV